MIGYVLLIVIAIALAAMVYPYLKARLPVDQVECPADLSVSIENVSCDKTTRSLTLNLLNNGLFNITGAYIRFAESGKSIRPQINKGKELYLIIGANPRPLGPGEETLPLTYTTGTLSAGTYIVEVQPAIFKNRALVPCINKIVTQSVECN